MKIVKEENPTAKKIGQPDVNLNGDKLQKIVIKDLPTPLHTKFIVENPIKDMKVQFPDEETRRVYFESQLSKLMKVKVLKTSSECKYIKPGDWVKIIPGRIAEGLTSDYLIYYESDVSCVWP